MPARGGTAEELASRIEAKLGTAYLRDPDVTVEVATYRPFFVLGEVGNPGQYVYVPKMTAETAIAAAGGFTDRANERIVRVSRIVNGKLVEERIPVIDADSRRRHDLRLRTPVLMHAAVTLNFRIKLILPATRIR